MRVSFFIMMCVHVACAAPRMPATDEFQVNTYTTSNQHYPAIASVSGGGIVIAWESYGQDGDDWGIFAQRFDAAGNKAGAEFQVNTYTNSAQELPAVASLSGGGFVIVWQSNGQDGSTFGIFGQRFDAAGNKEGSEFQVNTYTTLTQQSPAIASLSGGGFVIVWQSNGQDGSNDGIFAQRFDAAGNKEGSEFQVNTYSTSSQQYSAIASLPGGGFVIVWHSDSQDGSSWGIFAQQFDAAGNKAGSEFQVNTYTTLNQQSPAIASLTGGGFVIAWQSNGQDGDSSGIFAQRFDAAGNKAGSEFQVNTYTTSTQQSPAIASLTGGEFVIAWESYGQDGDGWGIFGQRFSSVGDAVDDEFQINTFTTGGQYRFDIASLDNNEFVAAWSSDSQDGDFNGVFATIFWQAQRHQHPHHQLLFPHLCLLSFLHVFLLQCQHLFRLRFPRLHRQPQLRFQRRFLH